MSAYSEGYRARMEGQSKTCPYDQDEENDLFQEWLEGYEVADLNGGN